MPSRRPRPRPRPMMIGFAPAGTQIPNPGYPGPDQPAVPPQDDRPGQEPLPGQAPAPMPGRNEDPMSGWPIPHKTWQTKGGSQVTVAGCCLPLPLGLVTVIGAGAVAGLARLRSRR